MPKELIGNKLCSRIEPLLPVCHVQSVHVFFSSNSYDMSPCARLQSYIPIESVLRHSLAAPRRFVSSPLRGETMAGCE